MIAGMFGVLLIDACRATIRARLWFVEVAALRPGRICIPPRVGARPEPCAFNLLFGKHSVLARRLEECASASRAGRWRDATGFSRSLRFRQGAPSSRTDGPRG